ncbi:hypothetical protein NY78_1508 [Desulfovibrio sp. TomC]|nr:hypothetical protein NY78_1508 [Desulfovibrio sp. TomC]
MIAHELAGKPNKDGVLTDTSRYEPSPAQQKEEQTLHGTPIYGRARH